MLAKVKLHGDKKENHEVFQWIITNCEKKNYAGGRRRHAFIGIGFRERTEAYDFQAALHDHMK